MSDKFYRYNYYNYEDGCQMALSEYVLIKKTKCGNWISNKYFENHEFDDIPKKQKHWVSNTSNKKFAYPTKKEALLGFYHRKRMQAVHCEYFKNIALRAKRIALEMLDKDHNIKIGQDD